MSKKIEEPKDLGITIVERGLARWIKLRDATVESVETLGLEIVVQEHIIKLCDSIIKDKKGKV